MQSGTAFKKTIKTLAILTVFISFAMASLVFGRQDKEIELPKDPFERGKVLYKLERYAEAKPNFEQALKKNPKRVQVRYYLGKTLFALNNLNAAWNNFDRLVQIAPKSPLGYLGRAEVLIKREQYDNALADIFLVEERQADIADSYYFKGLIYGYKKSIPEAVTALEKCLEIQPNYSYAHYQLGLAYYQIKRFDLTIVHLSRFLDLEPKAPEAEQVRALLDFIRKRNPA